MKKLIFIAICTLSVLGVQAQYSHTYYHKIGDTIDHLPSIYYHDNWLFDNTPSDAQASSLGFMMFSSVGSHATPDTPYYGPGTYVYGMYTPDTLKVIGIAALIAPSDYYHGTQDILLYDGNADGSLTLKRITPWTPSDPIRHWHIKGMNKYSKFDSCCAGFFSWAYMIDVREYYYDTTYLLTDSIFLGFFSTEEGYAYRYYTMQSGWPLGIDHYDCEGNLMVTYYPFPCNYQFFNYRTKIGDRDTVEQTVDISNWRCEADMPNVPLILPIIQVDTTVPEEHYCPPVENLQVTRLGSDLMLTWDAFPNHQSYTIDYSYQGANGRGSSSVTTDNNLYTLHNVDTTSTYIFQVQATCDSVEKRYSPISDTVGYHPPLPTEGIDIPNSNLSRLTVISPNPAKGSVTVSSSYSLKRVEAYNAAGLLVYSEAARGVSTTIDLAGWPSGTYIFMVHTMRGKTAKRLMVR